MREWGKSHNDIDWSLKNCSMCCAISDVTTVAEQLAIPGVRIEQS